MESKSEVDGAPAPATDSLKTIESVAPLAKPIETVTLSNDAQNNGNNEPTVTTNTDTVNKTTTTVTVNISQTKVVVDGADKEQNIEKVAATFGSIAAETVNAVENSSNVPADSVEVLPDVEMAEVNDDVDMVETSTTPVTSSSAPIVAATDAIDVDSGSSSDVIMSNSEADDVEKNISNLFNGDDGAASNSIVNTGKSDAVGVTNVKVDESNENGSGTQAAASSSNETTIESHDLVSILTGTDKADDVSQISSSGAGKAEAAAEPVTAQKVEVKEPVISAPDAPAAQKTSSSDSVAVEESAVDTESGVASKTAKKEVISSHSSTVNEKPTVSGM